MRAAQLKDNTRNIVNSCEECDKLIGEHNIHEKDERVPEISHFQNKMRISKHVYTFPDGNSLFSMFKSHFLRDKNKNGIKGREYVLCTTQIML